MQCNFEKNTRACSFILTKVNRSKFRRKFGFFGKILSDLWAVEETFHIIIPAYYTLFIIEGKRWDLLHKIIFFSPSKHRYKIRGRTRVHTKKDSLYKSSDSRRVAHGLVQVSSPKIEKEVYIIIVATIFITLTPVITNAKREIFLSKQKNPLVWHNEQGKPVCIYIFWRVCVGKVEKKDCVFFVALVIWESEKFRTCWKVGVTAE